MIVPLTKAEIILRMASSLANETGQSIHEARKRAVEFVNAEHPDVKAFMAESEKIDPAAIANTPRRPCC